MNQASAHSTLNSRNAITLQNGILHWMQHDGATILVVRDPGTEEERVVILNNPEYVITVYKAEIDLKDISIKVHSDRNLMEIDIPPEAWLGDHE